MDTLALRGVVERFVASAAQPAVIDPGEEPFRLLPERWSLTEWNGRLMLQAWDSERNLARKVTGVLEERRDRLSLRIEKFAKATGELQITDLAAPLGKELERKGARMAFRERFGLMLAREFPDWQLAEISTEPNLEASLSPSFVRAMLRKGAVGIAVLGAAPEASEPAGLAPFGVIWLDYLRRREPSLKVANLLLFAPAGDARDVGLRAALLGPQAGCRLYLYDEKGRCGPVDFTDVGNVTSSLPPCRRAVNPNAGPLVLPDLPEVERVEQSDGSVSLRVRGLEFARWAFGKLSCGVGRRRPASPEHVVAMAREVARVRSGDAEDQRHPLYLQYPEGWLEAQVRQAPGLLDASLLAGPIYGQVPVFGGPSRGIIDLLAVDHKGRLAVIEIKAAADPQLPFQAIDYWLRVRKHLRAGDFERLGYFPGIVLSREEPRILLVAPALEFHSTSETVIGALAPGIEIVRLGLAADWRRELRVMFRLCGAERP